MTGSKRGDKVAQVKWADVCKAKRARGLVSMILGL